MLRKIKETKNEGVENTMALLFHGLGCWSQDQTTAGRGNTNGDGAWEY